jgi:DNA-binding transcriptional ArsR family regulator
MLFVILCGMDVFEAVAEPTRRAVLDLLAARERSAGELVAAFPTLTQPAVSRHLRILRESHLVDVRADGTRRLYSLRPAALAELDRWLDSYRRFWGARLDDLESHLDAKTRGGRDGAPGRSPVRRGLGNHAAKASWGSPTVEEEAT